MSDMLAATKRGWDLLMREPLTLLLAGLFWTLLCHLLAWIPLGFALYGLFTIALKAHRREQVAVSDAFSGLDDIAPPLVAGVVFVLPFSLHAAIAEIPAHVWPLTAFLLIHFSYFVYVFAILADRKAGLAEATQQAVRLADGAGARTGRLSKLGRHLLYTSAVGAALVGVMSIEILKFPAGIPVVLIVAGPLAVCMLTAWYVQLAHPESIPSEDEDTEGEDLDAGAASAG